MSLYLYHCKSCGKDFELLLKVEERENPIHEPCPECNKEKTIEMLVGTVAPAVWKCSLPTNS